MAITFGDVKKAKTFHPIFWMMIGMVVTVAAVAVSSFILPYITTPDRYDYGKNHDPQLEGLPNLSNAEAYSIVCEPDGTTALKVDGVMEYDLRYTIDLLPSAEVHQGAGGISITPSPQLDDDGQYIAGSGPVSIAYAQNSGLDDARFTKTISLPSVGETVYVVVRSDYSPPTYGYHRLMGIKSHELRAPSC